MEIVSSAELTISYDGELLRTGLMDVQELAPALLASGTLIQKANRLVNGDRTHVSLKVRSDFRRGSFLINFVVDQSLLDQAKTFLLQHPDLTDATQILQMLFFWVGIPVGAGTSLFKLIKRLGNRKPDSIVFEDSNVTIISGDVKMTVSDTVYQLYSDPEARRAANAIVAPLNKEGIDVLEIKRGTDAEIVTKDEAASFEYSAVEGDLLLDTSRDAWLAIVSLSFNPEHKWRFSEGITARIEDATFWTRVHKHEEIFEEGDQLLVGLRTRTRRDKEGTLHTENVIEKVLQHVHVPKQPRLRF